jgi:FkbM family methyltransferase
MQTYSRLKQYYRYLRNWKKLQSRNRIIEKNESIVKQLEFYSQYVKKGSLCFDIGANIGDKTNLFTQLGAEVVAVEPQESCWRVLRRRFNNSKVFIEPVALDSKDGSKAIFVDRSHTLATISEDWISTVKQSGRFSSHKWNDRLSVRTTTLDNMIEKYGKPVFCKIDVEGAEFEVLQGLSQTIDVISIEFVSERIEASINCINSLCRLGKAEFNYYLGESMSFVLPEWASSDEITSILTTMSKDLENFGELYARFVSE